MSPGWIAVWSTIGAVALGAVVEEVVRRSRKSGARREKEAEDDKSRGEGHNKMAREALTAYIVALSTANDWLRRHSGDLSQDGLDTIAALGRDAYRCWDAAKVLLWNDGTVTSVLDAAQQRSDSVFRQIEQERAVPDQVDLQSARDDVRALLDRFR